MLRELEVAKEEGDEPDRNEEDEEERAPQLSHPVRVVHLSKPLRTLIPSIKLLNASTFGPNAMPHTIIVVS